jgi:hypothetical protein
MHCGMYNVHFPDRHLLLLAFGFRKWGEVFVSSFSTRSHHTTLSWTSLLLLLAEALLIISLTLATYGTTYGILHSSPSSSFHSKRIEPLTK